MKMVLQQNYRGIQKPYQHVNAKSLN